MEALLRGEIKLRPAAIKWQLRKRPLASCKAKPCGKCGKEGTRICIPKVKDILYTHTKHVADITLS